jgi:transcriptional regulator
MPTTYLPPQFAGRDAALACQLMREHPFAMLLTSGDDGLPFVTHLPMVLEERGAGALALLGHVAKPNPQWRHLQARPRAVVVFRGPQAYLSPTVYPDLARVPTWNYLAVHATVEAQLIDAPAEKDALLKRLIGEHEPAYAQQWRDLGSDFQHKMLAGIVGFELTVVALEAKFKLNQHRAESHAAMHAQYAAGTPDAQALALWMGRLGLATTAAEA